MSGMLVTAGAETLRVTPHAIRRAFERCGWPAMVLEAKIKDGLEVVGEGKRRYTDVAQLACGAWVVLTRKRPGHERRVVITVLAAWMVPPLRR